MITIAISKHYLTKQRLKASAVAEEVWYQCKKLGLKPPSSNTIRTRIRSLRAEEVTLRRHGRNEARTFQPIYSSFPKDIGPLDVFQVDHTKVDIIVVDDITRQPIGRPYLTLAIDVYSRCIAGICLTLEAPSAVSVGLCLAQAILPKEDYLSSLNIEDMWPVWGKPKTIYVDNGSEFHSEALRRGCEQHGIRLEYRPPGQPHYGGVVERIIGTLMHKVHSLPGTTFSSIADRGSYDAEAKSIFTLKELEKWLVLLIIGHYHQALHKGIGKSPLEAWKKGVTDHEIHSEPLKNSKAFLIDFLPIVYRRIQRQGFVIDHIVYYSSHLRSLISNRSNYERFLIRRDPRDLSRIYVLHPENAYYLEVPYRTLYHPSLTLWEHHEVVKRLHKEAQAKIDESIIFQTLQKMRHITEEAALTSKKARRRKVRTTHLSRPTLLLNQQFM